VAKTESPLYKPADACRMAEVAPYVLRYWETEFSALSEGKEKGPTRLYTARDVQIISRIRQLLYDEGFTVAGAKKRLEAEIQEGRFEDGDQASPITPGKRKLEDEPMQPKAAAKAPAAVPAPAPPPPRVTTPAPAPAVSAAPAPAAPAREATSFPERKTVIKELKEIVRLLEKPAKR
jgi:DNA-binding transcriptional MerR regulator